MFFTTAIVEIKPKTQTINLKDEVLTATMKTASTQDFPYEVLDVDKTTYKTIESTGQKYVELKASGQITIFNTYSTASQNLAVNTRFALLADILPGQYFQNKSGRKNHLKNWLDF
jgi:hypothetical protein